jgi:hypothetical protein
MKHPCMRLAALTRHHHRTGSLVKYKLTTSPSMHQPWVGTLLPHHPRQPPPPKKKKCTRPPHARLTSRRPISDRSIAIWRVTAAPCTTALFSCARRTR